jgi:hypothetical protein
MRAWHFLKSNKTLRYDDKTQVELGVTIKCAPNKVKLCEFGFHASLKPLDALSFVNWEDAVICLVELGGTIIKGDDKVVASERTVIAWCSADDILHEFACQCAESTLHHFERSFPNDSRPRLAIEAKRQFKRGEISAQKLNAAESAARAAALAAWSAARSAESAAQSAARAAESAAESAARAAEFAAWSAARSAALAAWSAARSAASAARAAEVAAWSAQNALLESLFLEALGLTKEDLK